MNTYGYINNVRMNNQINTLYLLTFASCIMKEYLNTSKHELKI